MLIDFCINSSTGWFTLLIFVLEKCPEEKEDVQEKRGWKVYEQP
jgi:hypothetical protein